MANEHEDRPALPSAIQIAWKLVWVLLSFIMILCGVVGLNFVVVGIISLFVDLGAWGPRLNGDLIQASMDRIVFTVIGTTLALTSVGFFWLGSRKRYGAAVVYFAIVVASYFAVGWTTGVHDVSGGVGRAGFSGNSR